jgi:hypothetical protein
VVSTGSFCLVQIPLGFCLVQMLFWENIIDQFLNRRFDAETVVVEVMSTALGIEYSWPSRPNIVVQSNWR